ncbi:MAG: hypothetical protein HC819_18280 [Cyclobacteriaceae bacterium]|nr:hypothetical protein [Cyclobacteriaceae bacterium]
MNANKLDFDEVIVGYDSALKGVIYLWSSQKIEYIQDEDTKDFMLPLFKKILEINPDFILSVYNLPEVYWYVKDDKLYALSYAHQDKTMRDFRIWIAKDYIKTCFNDKELMFLSPKRVKVVSGK